MQPDMSSSTTGHTISSLRSRLKSVSSSTMHQPYYPISRGKPLKKLNSLHRPKSLREAMDVTMDIKVEHQITQPESQLAVMETCYEEPILEETYITEEVQTRSQV